MDFGLRGRVALVTGSSMGIGKAIAYGLAREGVKATICARNEERLKETAEEIAASTGVDVLPAKADLRNPQDMKSLIRRTVENFGRLDILVNNTGGPLSSLFMETSDRDWREAVDSLLMSVVNCCREAVPYMKERMWGRIINMTSFAAKQPAERLVLSNAFGGNTGVDENLI